MENVSVRSLAFQKWQNNREKLGQNLVAIDGYISEMIISRLQWTCLKSEFTHRILYILWYE